ncbi:MAG: cation diffusion facilitator family transporter [Candidatus Xenobia bacterium]
MSHDHDHCSHDHNHAANLTGAALSLAFFLTIAVLVVDVVQGFRSGSLALLSDALHVGTDLFSLGLAWWAVWQSTRPADASKTFGYHRTTILAALTNALTLIGIVLVIAHEAADRFYHPHPVNAWQVIPAALLSIFVNLFIVLRLNRTESTDVNIRSASLHVLGDVGASIAVVIGAIIMIVTGLTRVDSVLSVLIALLVLFEAWKIIAETVNVLMEGTPPKVDVERLIADVKAVPGVKELHDLHVWNISTEVASLSCHLVLEDQALSSARNIVSQVESILTGQFGLNHTTIQLETESCGHALYCTIDAFKRQPQSERAPQS